MDLSKDFLINALEEMSPEKNEELFRSAYKLKVANVGAAVHLRGLIEISNICRKNCLYCGIRRDNHATARYSISDEDVLEAARFASEAGYGSLVIQGGERNDPEFTGRITRLLRAIKEQDDTLGITLSLGEQSMSVYREWFRAGAHRYLLRIESSNEELYYRIHPKDSVHDFKTRLRALYDLRDAGYQVGTGVMIGLPFQTSEDLANDLLFFKQLDIDMCGMGPYLEHSQTPLYEYRDMLLDKQTRFQLTLKMVALLRHLMPDINIAATTALQVIDPDGREKAVMAGANIIMPNMTLQDVRDSYQIYENKPGIKDDAQISKSRLEDNLRKMNIPIGWKEWGDSRHFRRRC